MLSLIITSALAALVGEVSAAGPGVWGETITFPMVPAAAAIVPQTGKLLVYSAYLLNAFSPAGPGKTETAEYDPITKQVTRYTITNTNHDMFCPGMSFDFTGDLVVTGGNSAKKTSIYTGGVWQPAPDMAIARGYQSTATTSEGNIFNIGGSWSGGLGGKNGELWNGTAWRLLSGAPVAPLLTKDPGGIFRQDNHAMLFGWKKGSVFHAGPSVAMLWYGTTGNGNYSAAGKRGTDTDAMCGIAAMYDAVAGKILVVGGSAAYEAQDATSNANIITIGNPYTTASVTKIGNMAYRRIFANGVVLPDGKVLILGGQVFGKPFSDETSTQVPELFDPSTRAFTQLAKEGTPRTYHSVGLLMPDGTVFSGGGGLCGTCETNHFDGQIFSPPYLFGADGVTPAVRPVIASTSATTFKVGATISVTLAGNSPNANAVFSLVRVGSSTHTVNTDQRRVPLTATGTNGTYTMRLPTDPGVVLPGYWFLFALVGGVPSVSKTVLITPVHAQPPTHFRPFWPVHLHQLFPNPHPYHIRPNTTPSTLLTRSSLPSTSQSAMSLPFTRALTRQPASLRLITRRAASTTSEASNAAAQGASKAKEAAGGAASKASEGLSRVTSSAGPALNKAGAALGNAANALGKVGGRTGRLITFVQSLVPPTIYYSKVGLELGKLIVQGRKMSPPDVATFRTYFQPLINAAKNPGALLNATPSANPNSILSRIRNVDNQQLVQAGIVGAEVIGFFTIGEMIGRLKIVGYRTSGHAHGEH
ncbi:hypothetical protein KVT40_001854 [Elsinoe batatas]|uniref:Galactose oxidase-like Early set domain-containing protein n=1 Tax=Elsinoe batatas TaxID=2601811 RepID=A0A8K0L9Z5_9PEZI|nr:hypothetical protein KVT40_001854 [Elsinoe batatas]